MSTKIPIFWKKCPKSFHKILQNTKYIRKYDFYKMCTSGRINFFWGVFSAFTVYALTLISTGYQTRFVYCAHPHNTQNEFVSDNAFLSKNYYILYIVNK